MPARRARRNRSGRGVIAQDFAFRGNKAGNTLRSFHDHGPGRGAVGTTRTDRARADLVRTQGRPRQRHCACREPSLRRAQNLRVNSQGRHPGACYRSFCWWIAVGVARAFSVHEGVDCVIPLYKGIAAILRIVRRPSAAEARALGERARPPSGHWKGAYHGAGAWGREALRAGRAKTAAAAIRGKLLTSAHSRGDNSSKRGAPRCAPAPLRRRYSRAWSSIMRHGTVVPPETVPPRRSHWRGIDAVYPRMLHDTPAP